MLRRFPYALIAIMVLARGGALQARDTLAASSLVRSLSPVEAGKFWRVDLNGVVVCREGGERKGFVMQDGTGSVFVELPAKAGIEKLAALEPGLKVNVRGFTIMGENAPRVKLDGLDQLGMGEVPAPVILDAGEVADGRYGDRYVEFNAITRSCHMVEGGGGRQMVVGFGPGNRRIVVRIWLPEDLPVPVVKVDDLVRIRGVVAERSLSANPQAETTIVVDHAAGLEVLFRGASGLAAIPETPISVLLAQNHDPFLEKRRKIKGVVTLAWLDRLVVVEKDRHAIRITPPADLRLKAGDEVEVAGIPTLYEDGLLMEQSVFSPPSAGHLPEPEPVQRKEMAADSGMEWDARYLSLGGVVVETGHRERDYAISVESDHGIFRCLLPRSEALPEGVKEGAYVEVAGVCRLLYGWEIGRKLKDFELLLPDASAIRVRTVPSWWTPWRLGVVFTGAGAVVTGLFVWGLALRRKVRVRTELLAREKHIRREVELISGERSRLAMELHDGVSQVLSAAAFQLEAATRNIPAGEREENRLHLIKKLLEHGREDLRRAVWDLTPGALENLGLTGALHQMAEAATAEGPPSVSVSSLGAVDAIPSRIRSHLFRLIQEGVTNAVRHSGAGIISVLLEVDSQGICVEICDDGKGFIPKDSPGPAEGHFGLYSMRTRVKLLKGGMNLESSSSGTSIQVRIPAGTMDEEVPDSL